MAFISCSLGTNVDTTAVRTGWPIAMKRPSIAALTVAENVVMCPVLTHTAVQRVMPKAPT